MARGSSNDLDIIISFIVQNDDMLWLSHGNEFDEFDECFRTRKRKRKRMLWDKGRKKRTKRTR